MATRGKKVQRRVSKRSVKLWFGRDASENGYGQEYDVHPVQPRIKTTKGFGGGDTYLISKKRGSRYNNGNIVSLCEGDVSKTLGLNLRPREAIEVTFTFGKVVKL